MIWKTLSPLLLVSFLGGCAVDQAQSDAQANAQFASAIQQVSWNGELDMSVVPLGEEAALIAALRAANLSPVDGDGQSLINWGLSILSRKTDALGNLHIRFGLSRFGHHIDGLGLNVSLKNGVPYAMVGRYTDLVAPQFPSHDQTDEITDLALKVSGVTRSDLASAPSLTSIYRLKGDALVATWRVDLRTDLTQPRLYIEAEGYDVLSSFDRAHHGDSTGSGPIMDTDEHSGAVATFGVHFDGSQYLQQDNSRGSASIKTYDVDQCGSGTSLCGGEAKSPDNTWEKAHNNSAHSLTGKVLDFWSERYGLNSFDDRGTELRVFQMQDSQYDNAYWNGIDSIVIGDGTYNPGSGYYDFLSRGDIMAHELGHAVEGALGPDLLYRGESGALAEAVSDMAGSYFERWYESGGDMDASAGDWLVGEDAIHSDSAYPYRAMRNMADPKEMADPDTWRGAYWVNVDGCEPSPSNDNCGVHSNSGVPNYAFYLQSEGGSGVNDHGYVYDVTPIGMEAAHAIVFQAIQYHLHEGSGMQGYYDAMVLAAEELYGVDSAESRSTVESLNAVGLRIVGNGVCELGEDESSAPEDCEIGQTPTPEPTPTDGDIEPEADSSYVDAVSVTPTKSNWGSWDMVNRVVVKTGNDDAALSGAWVRLRVQGSDGSSQVFEGSTAYDGSFSGTVYKVRRGVTLTACVESVEHTSYPWLTELDVETCDSGRAGR